MKAFVFLGPSLPVAVASRVLEATYLPPVQQGDILRLMEQAPDIIGIVDGYFEVVPAVWHKEILLALEACIRVFGASSMGALRAAELHAFGMVGVGRIFEWLRDGVIVRDDEVAVVHAPMDMNHRPLSDALVDIRDACACAEQSGIIAPDLAQAMVAAAEAMPFQERSYEAVARAVHAGSGAGEIERWLSFCRQRDPGLKARDAIALLQAIAGVIGAPSKPVPAWKLERTIFLNRLRMDVDLARFGAVASAQEQTGEGFGFDVSGRHAVLLRLLAREAAQRFGWRLEPDEVKEHASRVCARLKLSDAGELATWMQSRSLADEKFLRFVADPLLVAKLARPWRWRSMKNCWIICA
jgi:hypothetical protein